MSDSSAPLARLKRRLERLERPRTRVASLFALGPAALDARIGGGLATGALHEICGKTDEDHASASGFALMLCARASGDRPILWVREDKGDRLHGGLYAPGMVELGVDPGRLIVVHAPDTLAALRVGADIIGAMGLGAVVIELWGAAKVLDLTASRRLVLACEKSGVAAFVLRGRTSGFASAASTRWQVEAAPSQALPGNAPGLTALSLTLLRHRGGIAPFEMTLEWNHEDLAFREPALSRDLSAFAERGQMAA